MTNPGPARNLNRRNDPLSPEMVSFVEQSMTSELSARPTSNALITNYAHDVETDMMDLKHAPDAQMTSHERRYLSEFDSQMESGDECVSLAPSKLLRKPPSEKVRLHLPHRYNHATQYKSYDIPWDLIEEDSIKRSLYDTYKFVYFEMECNECNRRVLVPYMMPRGLSRIRDEMLEYISLPQHFCLEMGWVATIIRSDVIIPFKHSWGNPDRKKCRWSEVFNATRIDYKPFNCKIGTTNPGQKSVVQRSFYQDKVTEGLTLPMMKPLQLSQVHNNIKGQLYVEFVAWYPGGYLRADVLFDTNDLLAATYICTDLQSAVIYNHLVAIPLHLKGICLGDWSISKHPQEEEFKVNNYPFGELDGL